MKFKHENFPTVLEIEQMVHDYTGRGHVGRWPEDDWPDLGSDCSINI